ncbi:BrnT family toxin [Enterobacteriaceae bacterium ESL0689]|nr:BrnT family toxin [Enterobacteriaceae bacterium ESL0689]
MKIEYDQNKRKKTLLERGIDFARAGEVFAGIHFTAEDNRQNYGEIRNITVGKLDARLVVMVWTQRGQARRIISMRKANEREIKRFKQYLG